MGKSRVAPLKTVTVPRLELTAATLAVKLNKQICDELDLSISQIVFWSDSMIVLRYIKSENKRFQTFVANRLQVIHDASTRINGDMCQPSSTQPTLHQELDDIPDVEDTDVEVKKPKARVGAVINSKDAPPDSLIQLIHRTSEWYRLQKSVAWLLRFKQYILSRYPNGPGLEVQRGPLKVKEIESATQEIIKLTQRSSSINEKTMRERYAKLCPVIAGGIVRVGGRLDKSSLPEESKHPAILDSSHHVTKLIVRYYHAKEGHAGTSQTLAAIRQRFWIIKGPSTVKSIVNNCVPCRRRNQSPGKQIMAPLPKLV
ncbi:uncharacterized protein LOC124453977 [Xenia sp. Carnegie-2017]|uniref:uncharacterized protein LOC124453977 n=1 Tax=Xenia sp. Carnegie-2017 TaxID=2897299 RepID=UPI001F0372AF|nr:uncharacterized protein LOC124453977 [Xenia sp. Carnegie-2017]